MLKSMMSADIESADQKAKAIHAEEQPHLRLRDLKPTLAAYQVSRSRWE
jgi:hypothetical protein